MGFYCLLIEDEVMMPGLFLSIALQATPIVAPTTATPRTAEESAVLAKIDRVFAALEAGDGQALLEHVDTEGRVTGVGKRADGSEGARRRSFAEYAGHMTAGKGFVERITRPTIAIDADIAMVWAPFTIFANGKVTSCGFDHFDLIREGGVWKVANLTFSTSTNC